VLAKMPFLCINKPAIALVFEDESHQDYAKPLCVECVSAV
jgi:hypothetical protein